MKHDRYIFLKRQFNDLNKEYKELCIDLGVASFDYESQVKRLVN